MAKGIDYSGPGSTANRDPETGIRYGIIPLHALCEFALESFKPKYTARCPACGEDWPTGDDAPEDCARPDRKTTLGFTPFGADCPACGEFSRDDDRFSDEPDCNRLDDGDTQGMLDSSNDVWVFKSPYFTRAAFCSPCAPGACYLTSPCDDGERAYCLGHDWFDDGRAPYPVYSVETGELIEPANE